MRPSNTISNAAKVLLQDSPATPSLPRQKSTKLRDSTSQFNLNLLVENKDGIYDDQTKQAIKLSLKETYAMISQAKASKQNTPKRTNSFRGENKELNIANQIQRPTFSPTKHTKNESTPSSFVTPSIFLSPSPWVNTSPRSKKKHSKYESDDEIVVDIAVDVDDTTVALIEQDYRTI